MNAITQTLATTGQIRQIETVGKNALALVLEKLNPTKVGAQRVLESDEFADAMWNAAHRALSSLLVIGKYGDEEVSSGYGYLSGYTPKPLAEQVTRLKELYPQLKDAEVSEHGESPAGAEGGFAIPNVWKEDSLLTGTYNDSVVQMLERIRKDRKGNFHNYRDRQLGTDRLRQLTVTESAWKKISAEQGHPDILVIAAQFGVTHRGRSVRRAREVMGDQGQFGLGAFAVGIMILTHPGRLKHPDDLWIYCSGDEFDDPDASDSFGRAPCFFFGDNEVRFGSDLSCLADDHFGSASGFLPQ